MPPLEPSDPPLSRRTEEDWQDAGTDWLKHALVLIAWWREIVLVSVLAAAVGLAIASIDRSIRPAYTASAMVTIMPLTTSVSVTEEIQTVGRQTAGLSDVFARQAALLGLIHNGDIARAALRRMGERLNEDEDLGWLIGDAISGGLVESANRDNVSDLIRIEATTRSPETAQELANIWAEEYVSRVNLLWRTSGTLEALVDVELENARDTYMRAQKDLERHIARDEASRLERRILEKTAVIESLMDARALAIEARGLALSRIHEADKRVQKARIDTFNLGIDSVVFTLSDSYASRRELIRLLEDAQGLRDQIESGGEASGRSNGLAIVLLKVQAFASFADTGNLELRLDDLNTMHGSPAQQQTDVEALIRTLEDRIERLDAAIAIQFRRLSSRAGYVLAGAEGAGEPIDPGEDMLAGSVSSKGDAAQTQVLRDLLALEDESPTPLISSLENDIQTLRAAKEAMDAERTRLAGKRDLLLNSLKILQSRAAELDLEAAAFTEKVRLASPAVTARRGGIDFFLATVLAGIVGLAAAVFFAIFLANFMGLQPFLAWHKAAANG